MGLNKKKWSETSSHELSLDSIRTIYSNLQRHKVTENRYEPNLRFPIIVGLPYTLYVLDGECAYIINGSEFVIAQGEFAVIPKGEHIQKTGTSGVHVVKVAEW